MPANEKYPDESAEAFHKRKGLKGKARAKANVLAARKKGKNPFAKSGY